MRYLLFGAALLGPFVLPPAAANLPPVGSASATPTETSIGAVVQFSSAGSDDPDRGPQPLSFLWDFEDGGPTSSLPSPSRAFAAAGLYNVTLTLDDGADTVVVQVSVAVLPPPTAVRPTKSGLLALDIARAEVWTANEDAGSVSVVSTVTLTRVAEIPLGGAPRSLALTSDGTSLLVSDGARDQLLVLDLASRSLSASLSLCRGPQGVVAAPGSGKVLVACEDEDAVLVLDGTTLASRARIAVVRPHAIAVTADGTRAIVTQFLTRGGFGSATLLDVGTETAGATIALVADPGPDTPSSGRGYPNLLGEVAIDPAGVFAWLGGLKSNTDRGLFRSGQALVPSNRLRGLLALLDLSAGAEAAARRIDQNNADSVSGIAFSPEGRYVYALHPGTGELTTYDVLAAARITPGSGSAVPFTSRIIIGEAPRGLLGDGTRLYALGTLDRSLHVLDASDRARPMLVASIPVVAVEPLPASVLNGKRLFHRSRAPVHSEGGYIACASCHPGGSSDGRTWDFTQAGEGLRNTTDLRGHAGTGHGPVHWSANFDEIQDFENDIVNAFGGTGLAADGQPPNPPLGLSNAGRSRDLDDLAEYVASLDRAPRSPWRDATGSLTPSAERGREIFYRAATACATCHVPPAFTLSALPPSPEAFLLPDVGTRIAGSGSRLGGTLPGLDVPTIKGLWDSAPYLHAGQAVTERDVLTTFNPGDRHGVTSTLTLAEIDDLVRFLLELDESADVLPAALPPSVPGEVSPPGSPRPLLLVKRGPAIAGIWGFETRADDYRVVRGELGNWTSHTADASRGAGLCSTGGARTFMDPDDIAEASSFYYIVAGVNALGEGTYGIGTAPRVPSGDCP